MTGMRSENKHSKVGSAEGRESHSDGDFAEENKKIEPGMAL